MKNSADSTRELALLETIERDPDVTQASIATELDVAVGTVNWHIRRLIDKGYIKIKRANRKKLRYIITPEGIALRALLTIDYIEQQFLLYRNTRQHVKEHIERVRAAGFDRVGLQGEGDVADICRLTCLEQGIAVVSDGGAPVLVVTGLKVRLDGLQKSEE
ncbi:MAG: winged helix-turn-helix domain-containing protein [Chloroflexi bacterium]|nr:winged helix-turn-helix domain-containing protein [Chloroflexota bacterium]